MKIIYNTILDKLMEITAFRWADMDKGQLDIPNPPVDFPCALIRIDLPKCDDIGGNAQQVISGVTIRLAFKFTGQTSASTPEEVRNQSLSYFDTIEEVYKKFQGLTTDELSAFSRKQGFHEPRLDGITVYAMRFETDFQDYTAVV